MEPLPMSDKGGFIIGKIRSRSSGLQSHSRSSCQWPLIAAPASAAAAKPSGKCRESEKFCCFERYSQKKAQNVRIAWRVGNAARHKYLSNIRSRVGDKAHLIVLLSACQVRISQDLAAGASADIEHLDSLLFLFSCEFQETSPMIHLSKSSG